MPSVPLRTLAVVERKFPADVGDAPDEHQPDDARRQGDDQHRRRPDRRGQR